MDSDGQDNPDGIIEMIKKINSQNANTIVAKRGQRKEPLWFRFFYEIYCFTIMIFTLKKIRHGNFCLINYKDVNKILLNNDIWNAFPPVISVSLKTFDYITLDREERYAGASKMSFFGLIQHAKNDAAVSLTFCFKILGSCFVVTACKSTTQNIQSLFSFCRSTKFFIAPI